MEDKKVLLSVRDLEVKFRVRGRILTAIRGISLDIYENESIAIVGESGSGKSVFTKTFAGMLDSNGFISKGDILFDDEELEDTWVTLGSSGKRMMSAAKSQLDQDCRLSFGADTFKAIQALKDERRDKSALTPEEEKEIEERLRRLKFQKTETGNRKQTYDPGKEKDKIHEAAAEIERLQAEITALEKEREQKIREHKEAVEHDTAYIQHYDSEMARLTAKYAEEIRQEPTDAMRSLNDRITREIYLSIGRFPFRRRHKSQKELLAVLKKAFELGVDLADPGQRAKVFGEAVMPVQFLEETSGKLHGKCLLNLAKMRYANDWGQIRGGKIATVFQDPMTSLNPIITIGKQIMSIILKHQKCSEAEARRRALTLMHQVGIPNAESRFDDYPFQYSGGMRQRIVIAIALSCQPKILICDEPTTALDVTIQAQILKLIKDLQKEYGYTIVFITHDLGVVANVADRVAVLYAGQMIELGTVEEIFYDPRHPYTWALLSSLPQLAERDVKLYSITGTPPSLYNSITGDAFAPRNPYCLQIDTLKEPPMFKVTDTHYAKTWLLDPRAPKIEKPEIIQDIHGKLLKTYHLENNSHHSGEDHRG